MNKCTENIVREVIREYFISVLIEGKKPSGGLSGWFREKWVDISRKKKSGGHPPCGASAGSKTRKGGKRAYPKCVRVLSLIVGPSTRSRGEHQIY